MRYHKVPLTIGSLVALYRMADFCIVSSLHDGDEAEGEATLDAPRRGAIRGGLHANGDGHCQEDEDGNMGDRACGGSLVGRAAPRPSLIGQYKGSRGCIQGCCVPDLALPLPVRATTPAESRASGW